MSIVIRTNYVFLNCRRLTVCMDPNCAAIVTAIVTILTGNELVASAEAASGVRGIYCVEDE